MPRAARVTIAPTRHRALAAALLACLACLTGLACWLAPTAAHADAQTWSDVAAEMGAVLDNAAACYQAGDAAGAKAAVNDAYYGYYEKAGFEKTVMAYLSGERAAEVEYQFSQIKKQILAAAAQSEVEAHLETLKQMLAADAATLDGAEGSPWAEFASSLLIILREGFEAILVVGAVIAYLVKSENADKNRYVYAGVGLALLASVALAWAFSALAAISGAFQEVFEGATMLIAVAMLIWVSNWLLSKTDSQAWGAYVKAKSSAAIESGRVWGLAFIAFLAVFREGAETIIFYQALFARTTDPGQIWLGLGVGAVALVGVYLAIRYLGVRIPLRPFFLATSILLALMAVSFAGGGVKELQEGDVLAATTLPGWPTADLLGIYPTVETLAAQLLAIAAIALLTLFGLRKARRAAHPPIPSQSQTP
ncbi:MAG: FTR1 family iron permease [Propionibacteriaceae bacterium]|jgi:high-affinity iron transporter|nr:FTR1 family iron permease [Propionibacteriaceae bacterium]